MCKVAKTENQFWPIGQKFLATLHMLFAQSVKKYKNWYKVAKFLATRFSFGHDTHADFSLELQRLTPSRWPKLIFTTNFEIVKSSSEKLCSPS